jgi:hypothetical protein
MLRSRSLSVETVTIRVARLLAIISVWSVVMALGMSYFFSPIGAVAEPTFGDLIGFGYAFTVTGAVTASVALVLGGKRWWAVEIALAVGLMMATTAVLAYLALWAAPWTVRSRMDAWSFLRLRENVLNCGEAILIFHVPLGVGVGAVVGAITGRLIVIAHRRSRLARWISLGLLVTCASGPVRPIVFDLVILWGLVVRRPFATWPWTDEHVWATAAIFGAITGAIVACLSTRVARRHRSGHVSHTAGAGVPVLPRSPRSSEAEERGRRASEGSATRSGTQGPSD